MPAENYPKPRVGIPWRTSAEELGKIRRKLDYYFGAVREADADAFEVSLHQSPEQLERQLQGLDAFVLPGSPSDVNPALYRSARPPKTRDAHTALENTVFAAIEQATARGKPVLA